MGATRVQRLQKSMKPRIETRSPIANEMYLPNNSGDHAKSIKRLAPTGDKDLVNKEYVDLKADGVDPDHTHSKLVSPTGTNDTIIEITDNTSVGVAKTPDAGYLSTALPFRLNNNKQIWWERADGSPVAIFNVTNSDNLLFKIPRNGKYFVVQDPGSVTMFQVTDVGTTSSGYLNGILGIGVSSPGATLHVNGTDGIIVPVGTTGERVATQGMIRYNTTTSKFEGYTGAAWVDFH